MGAITQDRVARFLEKVDTSNERATLEEVCQRIIEGERLSEICAAWDVPTGRVRSWIAADNDRVAMYEGALRLKASSLVEQALEVADNAALEPADKKVRIDARFRTAGFYDRQRFGDGTAGQGLREIKITVGVVAGAIPVEQPPPAIEGEAHVRTD